MDTTGKEFILFFLILIKTLKSECICMLDRCHESIRDEVEEYMDQMMNSQ